MSQPLIIGAVTLAVVDTTITDLTDNDKANGPSFRIVIGGVVLMVTLLALADYNESLADSVALIIMVATLVGPKGGAVFKTISKITSKGFDQSSFSTGSDKAQHVDQSVKRS